MEMKFKTKIDVSNSAHNVWRALTESEFVQQYMFGSSVESDWTVGSSIRYFILQDGKNVDMVSGTIAKIISNELLEHSLYPVGASYPATVENHIHVTYTIRSIDENSSTLEIEQFGFEDAEDGEKRYNDSKAGWEMVLPKLKEVAESI